jgi:hypothetical protein
MTTTVPTRRHPAELLPADERSTFPTLWVCPTCGDHVRICDKPACITAEIDHDHWQDRNGDL